MIDTLLGNGEMVEADWKDQEYEIRTLLHEIRIVKNYNFTISDDDLYEDHEVEEILKLIDEKELQPQGYSIEILDINSDSYVFTIIALADKEEVKNSFAQLK